MKFNRAHPEDQSLVERAILNGLGVESLDFQPTAPREKIVPQRILDQRKRASKQKSGPSPNRVCGLENSVRSGAP